VIQRSRNFDFAHEPAQRLVSHSHFGQQGFDRHRTAGLFVARQRNATHATAPEDPDEFITGNRLWLTLEFFAAVFAKKGELFVPSGGASQNLKLAKLISGSIVRAPAR